MTPIQTDVSPQGMKRAVEENMFAACILVFGGIPGVDYRDDPELMIWASGIHHPLLNGASRARLTPETADGKILEAIALFRSREVPAQWWHEPSSQPTDLGERLVAHGFTRGRGMPGMAVDLRRPRALLPTNPAIQVSEVVDDPALRAWTDVCCRGFEMAEEVGEAFFTACSSIGYGADKPMRNFLCSRDGEPAACAALCIGAGVTGVYCVATVPEARRQGCGAAVVQACLDAAREQGYRIAILQASEMGEPVYRRLGFEEVCRIETYYWNPGA